MALKLEFHSCSLGCLINRGDASTFVWFGRMRPQSECESSFFLKKLYAGCGGKCGVGGVASEYFTEKPYS